MELKEQIHRRFKLLYLAAEAIEADRTLDLLESLSVFIDEGSRPDGSIDRVLTVLEDSVINKANIRADENYMAINN